MAVKNDLERELDGLASLSLEHSQSEVEVEETLEAVDDMEIMVRNGELHEDPHLLLLGRSRVGKSTLAGYLIDGVSTGVAGPDPGTTRVVHTPVPRNGVTFHVYDTRGLVDSTGIDELKEEILDFPVPVEKCLVLLCVRFDSGIEENEKLFDLCHSLSPNIWKEVVVAVTHSDIIPPESTDEGRENDIKRMKHQWVKHIQDQVRRLGVCEEDIEQLPIIFTTITSEENAVDPNWKTNLENALENRSGRGGFQFLVGKAFSSRHDTSEQPLEETPTLFEDMGISPANQDTLADSHDMDNAYVSSGVNDLSTVRYRGPHQESQQCQLSQQNSDHVILRFLSKVRELIYAFRDNFPERDDILKGAVSTVAGAAIGAGIGAATGGPLLAWIGAKLGFKIGATVGSIGSLTLYIIYLRVKHNRSRQQHED